MTDAGFWNDISNTGSRRQYAGQNKLQCSSLLCTTKYFRTHAARCLTTIRTSPTGKQPQLNEETVRRIRRKIIRPIHIIQIIREPIAKPRVRVYRRGGKSSRALQHHLPLVARYVRLHNARVPRQRVRRRAEAEHGPCAARVRCHGRARAAGCGHG